MKKKTPGKFATFRRKHPIIYNFLLICLTGLGLLFVVSVFLDFWTMHGSTAVVPDIRNRNYIDARDILAANGLTIEISDSVYDRNAAPGIVLESWPKPGAVVKEGRNVYVTVTAFSPKSVTISMPLTGSVSSRQAVSYLRGIGINDIHLEQVPSDYPDLVMGARFGDTPLTVGMSLPVTSTVTLEIGTGPVEPSDSLDVDELALDGAAEILAIEE